MTLLQFYVLFLVSFLGIEWVNDAETSTNAKNEFYDLRVHPPRDIWANGVRRSSVPYIASISTVDDSNFADLSCVVQSKQGNIEIIRYTYGSIKNKCIRLHLFGYTRSVSPKFFDFFLKKYGIHGWWLPCLNLCT